MGEVGYRRGGEVEVWERWGIGEVGRWRYGRGGEVEVWERWGGRGELEMCGVGEVGRWRIWEVEG